MTGEYPSTSCNRAFIFPILVSAQLCYRLVREHCCNLQGMRMRTFARKQSRPQKPVSSNFAPSHTAMPVHQHRVYRNLYLHRTIGDPSVQRMMQTQAEEIDAGLTGTSSPHFGHDFSQIPVRPPTGGVKQTKLAVNKPSDEYEQEADRVAEKLMQMPTPTPTLQRACEAGGASCPASKEQGASFSLPSIVGMQRKLTVGASNDPLEQEADRIADQALAISVHSAVRGASPCIQRVAGQQTGQAVAAPTSVVRTLANPGRPLEPTLRRDMEQRFGHNFSRVRIHSDTAAEKSAQDVSAHAYTVGNHIVFGTGRFASGSQEGRRLIAHELTHVLQQQAKTTQIQRQPAPAQVSPTLEDSQRSWIRAFGLPEFMKVSLRDFRESRGLYASFTKNNFKLANDRYLSNVLTGYLSTLIVGEEQTKALNGDQAVLQKLRDEYRKSIQFVIPKFASLMGRTPSKVLQTHHSEILDWALPRSSVDPKGDELSDALPDAERQRIQVSTTAHDLGNIEAYFVVRGNIRVTSTGAPVRFATNVPVEVHGGLENIARELARGSTRPNSNPMRPNQSITLSLNLDRFGGGNAAYRFTYVEHSAGTSGGRATREFLVERLGTIGVEGLAANQIVAQQERFDRHAFVRDRTFSSDREFEAVLQGLSQIEDATLAPINGLTFRRDRVHPTRPANGLYDPNTPHTITLYDSAFVRTQMRVGRPGEGLSSEATFTVRHEIGHAIDQARTRQHPRPPGAVDASATPEFRSAARRDGNVRITAYAQTDWSEFYAESFALYQSDPTGLQRLRPNLFNYFVRLFPR